VNTVCVCVCARACMDDRLLKQILREKLQFQEKHSWFLVRNNALANCAMIVKHFMVNQDRLKNMHPPYLPGIVPGYLFLCALK